MTPPETELRIWAPTGIGEITDQTNLGELLAHTFANADPQHQLNDDDVVVISSKIVSKAEGRTLPATDREDAITAETVRVVATRERPDGPPLRIVENRLGLVMAAAGVDTSNVPQGTVLLLPQDPDNSARQIRETLAQTNNVNVAVIITDTTGRPWRDGLVDIAIGAAGINPLHDERGHTDTHGRPLTVTTTALADQIAAAAELVKGKVTGRPVAVVRGFGQTGGNGSTTAGRGAVLPRGHHGPGARVLVRLGASDLFSLGTAEAYRKGLADGRNQTHPDGAPPA